MNKSLIHATEENMERIKTFLELIHGEDGIYFQIAGEKKNPQIPPKDFQTGEIKYPPPKANELESIWGKLESYYNNGYKVYFKLNTGGTRNDDIYRVNAQCIDVDFHDEEDAEELERKKDEVVEMLRNLDLPPSIIVKTRRGVHAYWLLKQEKSQKTLVQELYNFKKTQNMLASYFNSCSNVNKLSQAMRMPGFGAEIVEMHSERRYNQEELIEEFTIATTKKEKSTVTKKRQSSTNHNTSIKTEIKPGEKQIVYNYSDFFHLAKQQDLRIYLGLDLPINANFSCRYHNDKVPSAVISDNNENGYYRYFCNSSNCRLNDSNGKTILDLLLMEGKKWPEIIDTISKTFNIELETNHWIEKEKNKLIANLTFIRDELPEMKYTNQIVRYGLKYLRSIIHENIVNIHPALYNENGDSMFFSSNRHISRVTRGHEGYTKKVNEYINLFCMLGILKKEWPPENSKIAQESERIASEKNHRRINYYSMPNLYEIKDEVEERAKKMKKKGFSIKAISEVYAQNFDDEIAKEVYRGEKISRYRIKVREKILNKAIQEVERKGYFHWTDLVGNLKVQEQRIRREQIYREWKKVLPLVLDKGYEERKTNKELKERYSIEGWPWIIIAEDEEDIGHKIEDSHLLDARHDSIQRNLN